MDLELDRADVECTNGIIAAIWWHVFTSCYSVLVLYPGNSHLDTESKSNDVVEKCNEKCWNTVMENQNNIIVLSLMIADKQKIPWTSDLWLPSECSWSTSAWSSHWGASTATQETTITAPLAGKQRKWRRECTRSMLRSVTRPKTWCAPKNLVSESI